MNQKKLAVLVSFSGAGGVEKMITRLLQEFIRYPLHIDLLLIKDQGFDANKMPAGINLIKLKSRHTSTAMNEVSQYLSTQKPDAMLVAKDRAGRMAVKARRKAGVNTRLVLRLGTNLSTAMQGKSVIARWFRYNPIRRLYPALDKIVAVSQGVADDTIRISGMDCEKVCVIRNPVITAQLQRLATQSPPHAWLQKGHKIPVILGAGRLTRQKDFATLINAFHHLLNRIDARLILLGEGPLRGKLQEQIEAYGLADQIDLPGFQTNPYVWMKHADLFVLSSLWEGSPNVLTEAMALGIPVVSTDCPSGPAELLDRGRIAPLVAPGDAAALAEAMEWVLKNGADVDLIKAAVQEYNARTSAQHYLEALNLI
jgi:glycosyltransferase involved in cell wall biosynthesis